MKPKVLLFAGCGIGMRLRLLSGCVMCWGSSGMPGPTGALHAELTLGGGMIMLGSIRDNEFGRHMKQPDEIGGAETRSEYLIVSDADEVYRRVKSADAEIVIDIKDEGYGGRGFTCRDPEGRIWSVGTYDPWKAK